MGCPIILNGVDVECKGMGGIKEIYIADAESVTSVTLDTTENIIDTITMDASGKFYTYKLRKQTAGMESTINADDAAGTIFYETVLDASFQKMTTSKRVELQALAIGNLAVIVKDNNDKYWYLGYDNPVTLTGGAASTGIAFGDANQ